MIKTLTCIMSRYLAIVFLPHRFAPLPLSCLLSHHTPLLVLLHFLQHLQHSMLGRKADSFPTLAVLSAARAWQELMRGTGFWLVHARPPGRKVILSDIWYLSISFFVPIILLVPLVGVVGPWGVVITSADDVRRRIFSLTGLYGSHLRTEGRLVSTTKSRMQGDDVSILQLASI